MAMDEIIRAPMYGNPTLGRGASGSIECFETRLGDESALAGPAILPTIIITYREYESKAGRASLAAGITEAQISLAGDALATADNEPTTEETLHAPGTNTPNAMLRTLDTQCGPQTPRLKKIIKLSGAAA